MPYTRHGHPFGEIDVDAPRPRVDRCGGVAHCGACKADVAAASYSIPVTIMAGFDPRESQWRAGRHQPRMIYAQTPTGDDALVGLVESAELAEHIVALQNREAF